MKRENIVILFVLIIVTLVASVVFLYNPTQTQNPPKTQNSTQSNPVVSVTGNSINSQTNSVLSSELSKHNLKSDCWISYKGKVYDVTQFLPKHPGSADAIAPYCGTSSEFEGAFSGQHGTSKVSILLKEGTYKGDLK